MIPILVGSQTGNGLHLAKLLSASIPNTFTLAVDDFDLPRINEFTHVVFILSTHGDGQCPYNASRLYNLLITQCASKAPKRLFRFSFALLGLGDSSYQKYNYCARVFLEKLQALGATCVIKEFSDTQDPNGMYDGFWRFRDSLVGNGDTTTGLTNGITGFSRSSDSAEAYSAGGNTSHSARVVSNVSVTPNNYSGAVYELVLDVPDYKRQDFTPGDTLSILPENIVDLSLYFNFTTEQINLLKRSVDFLAPVYQTAFVDLARFTQSETYRDKLLEISQDYDLYHDYVVVPKRNILEVIRDFDLDLPFEFLKDLNRIYPRYFSFALIDNEAGESRLHILYNIVQYKTYLDVERLGLCSQYLSTLTEGDTIQVGVSRGRLFFGEKKLLFFATGTGVTLPRSVVHHFNQISGPKQIKVFYGFRYFGVDQLCKDEMAGVDVTYVASRDEGRYITDAYKAIAVENIDEWLIFVSGNCRLNKSIRELLRGVHGKDVPFQSETW